MRLLLSMLLVAASGPVLAAPPAFVSPDFSDRDRLVILVFGDSGTGDAGQYRVGQAMYDICRERACDFALMLGDNIYENGIRVTKRDSASGSLEEIRDQFQAKFEAPYRKFRDIADFVFFPVLGNHDYRSNTIATYVTYSEISPLWRMPALHFDLPGLPEWIQIYGLLTDTGVRRELNGLQVDSAKRSLCAQEPEGRWKIAYGHQPVHNSGHHRGDSRERRARAMLEEPLLRECGVHLYLSGHAHHQEHLTARGFEQVIQGAAGKSKGRNRPPASSALTQRHFSREFGFAILEVDASRLRMDFYDVYDTRERGTLVAPGPEDVFRSYSWCGTREDIGRPDSGDRPCR